MDRPDAAVAVDANFRESFAILARATGEGIVRAFGPLLVAATGLPVAYFNAVFAGGVGEGAPSPADDQIGPPSATGRDAATDRNAALHAAATELGRRGLPFVVHLGPHAGALRPTLVELGLVPTGTMPGMAMEPRPAPAVPTALRIVRATDEAMLADHRAVAASAFGLPVELVERLMPAGILSQPGLRVYAAYVDDEPVASGLGYRRGDVLGVYNIATVAEARGRGYGTAMTWATLTDAGPGVRLVILQASDAGRPIYERMGFLTVVDYEEYETPDGGV